MAEFEVGGPAEPIDTSSLPAVSPNPPTPTGGESPTPTLAEQLTPTPTPTLAEQLVPSPTPTETVVYVGVEEPDREPPITLGSWPDWIAAVGTSLAFLIAAVTYFRSARAATESQARLVYAKVAELRGHGPGEQLPMLGGGAKVGVGEGRRIIQGPPGTQAMNLTVAPIMRAVVRVHNGSDELMGPVKVQLWDTGLNKPMERVTLELDQIEPGVDAIGEMMVVNEHFPGEPGVSLVLVYRDSSRRWWKRQGVEPIERIHYDPHTMAETPAQREDRAKTVRALGMKMEPLPRITLAVRWHRLWRRLRGKQPVP